VCAGALRRYFAGNKEALAKAMIAGVPASLRVPGDTSQSNQVTMMLVNMATHIADPRKRLAAIIKASTKAKSLTGSMKSLIPMDLPSLGIPWLMSVITPLYRTAVATNRIPVVANLVVSNVPGPQMPLYLAGAELKTYYPVSIVTHGLALNITIQSYAGSLYYGLIACKQSVPDLRDFAEHMRASHEELRALSRQPHAPAPKAGRKAVSRTAGARHVVATKAKTGGKVTGKPVVKRAATQKTVTKRTATRKTATRKKAMTKPATAKPALAKLTKTRSKAKKKT